MSRFPRLPLRIALPLLLSAAAASAQLGIPGFELLAVPEATEGENPRLGSSVAIGDFDGDGLADFATGARYTDLGGQSNVGAIHLLLVAENGTTDHHVQVGCPVDFDSGDRTGETVVFGDFDDDGDDEMVVGRPGYDLPGAEDAGGLCVHEGGTTPFSATSFFTQSLLPGEGPEDNDQFGSALAVGDLDGDGYDDLAVASRAETLGDGPGAVLSAGVVHVLWGGPEGLGTDDAIEIHRDSPGVGWDPAAVELFGASLAIGDLVGLDGVDDLAIGAPGDNPAGVGGSVTVLLGAQVNPLLSGLAPFSADGAPYDLLTTGTAGDELGAALAVGDFDGDGDDDLAVGIPGDAEFAAATEPGAVLVLYRDLVGLTDVGEQVFFETLFAGTPQNFDRMGDALASGDFDADGRDDLAIGIPFDDALGVLNSGKVLVVFGAESGLELAGFQALNMTFFGGAAVNDQFGSSLTSGTLFDRHGGDDLLVGMEGRDGWAGAALVVQSVVSFADGFESGDTTAWGSAP